MKIFNSHQIRAIDGYTIENEPVASIDLMERAALAIKNWVTSRFNKSRPFVVFAGTGNNGGDGLALARLLRIEGFSVEVYITNTGSDFSADLQINIQRYAQCIGTNPTIISNESEIPLIDSNAIIVDSIFGSGLTRPPSDFVAKVISFINNSGATVLAIDMPSGLFDEKNEAVNSHLIIRANYTLALQFPKLSFFFPENHCFIGQWEILPIGLHPYAIKSTKSTYEYVLSENISLIFPARSKFSHKGTYGHCMLIAGMYGMCGAAILAAKAAIRSGVGLLTIHTPAHCYPIVQQCVPEAIFSIDEDDACFTNCVPNSSFTAIAIGPGIGTRTPTLDGLIELLRNTKVPMVIDADALNLIATMPELLKSIPAQSIITPHPKEFERLFGPTLCGYSQLLLAIDKAREYDINIILKGAHSKIITPKGKVYINSTGNPGMATAGSGDVLTGIIVSLLAQKISAENAAVLGTYIHGLAGDLAAQQVGQVALTATYIIDHIGFAFKQVEKS